MLSPWVVFILSAAVVVITANRLAIYGDIIAVRTNLGGLVVGTIFLAAATSLPEIMASISAFRAGAPNLAAGNFFGSNMVNITLLALIDVVNYQVPLMRRLAITHTLTAALATLLMLTSVIFIMADINIVIGWVGIDSLILITLYFGGTWLIQQESQRSGGMSAPKSMPIDDDFPLLRNGVIGFGLSAIVLIVVVPFMVEAAAGIAEVTGLGNSFIGASLLSLTTSLPELLAAVAATRMGAFDLAVGNLFGSSVFNMLGLGISDFFYTQGRFLAAIDADFALVGLLALLLTNLALMANLARIERKILFIELDAMAIIFAYLAGMYLLFVRGLGA